MKKILLTSAILASSLLSFAQTQPQIPNGDFETWDVFSGCSGVDSAAHFSTTDEELYADTEICLSNTSVSKSTESHSGTYALLMLPLAVVNPLPPATTTFFASRVTTADTVGGSQIAFTGRPTKLTGYYKLNIVGADEFTINVGTLVSNAEDILAYGEFSTTTSASTYTKFEISLDYDPTQSSNPDSLFISFSLGNPNFGGEPNSYVLIDDLVFEYDTPTSTVNYSATSPINVYAANKNINFSENVSDVHVVDMVGASKMKETAATKTLNAGSLTTGMYIVTYKYNDAYFSKKVIIE